MTDRPEKSTPPLQPEHMQLLIRAVAEFTVMMGRIGSRLAAHRRRERAFLDRQDPSRN